MFKATPLSLRLFKAFYLTPVSRCRAASVLARLSKGFQVKSLPSLSEGVCWHLARLRVLFLERGAEGLCRLHDQYLIVYKENYNNIRVFGTIHLRFLLA